MADITALGSPPVVTELDGQLVVAWPNGKESTFIMRTSLFEAMIADINAAKRIVAALEVVRSTIGSLT